MRSIQKYISSFFLGAVFSSLSVLPSFAGTITLYQQYLPKQFMLMEKKTQQCYLFGVPNVENPLQYTCSSGQIDGDKIIEGDKKTPEGVYFVTGSILEGLDFQEYGSKAYPLDYPNVFDILDKKTGYGIWVHGKGKAFLTKSTRGCVAFPEKDMLKLYTNFTMDYPVIIADTIKIETTIPSQAYTVIGSVLTKWANTWTAHSKEFFSLYDAKRRANFTMFKANKEKVFAGYPFTYVLMERPNIVQKGSYFTTWFRQYYYAPNLLVEGTRYLYWTMENGAPKIVAEKWQPDTTPNTKKILTEKMLPEVNAFLALWKKEWECANIKGYSQLYTNTARQGRLIGLNAIVKTKEKVWKKHIPKSVSIENVRISLTKQGIEVKFKQVYTAGASYKDSGEKTLYILPLSTSAIKWKIAKEMWKPL